MYGKCLCTNMNMYVYNCTYIYIYRLYNPQMVVAFGTAFTQLCSYTFQLLYGQKIEPPHQQVESRESPKSHVVSYVSAHSRTVSDSFVRWKCPSLPGHFGECLRYMKQRGFIDRKIVTRENRKPWMVASKCPCDLPL